MCGFIHFDFCDRPCELDRFVPVVLCSERMVRKYRCHGIKETEANGHKNERVASHCATSLDDAFVDCRIIDLAYCRVKPLDAIRGDHSTAVQFACQNARHVEVFGQTLGDKDRIQD